MHLRLPALLILITLLFNSSELSAQQQKIKEKFCFEMQSGGRYVNRDSLDNSENLDFMNYFYQEDKGADYSYVGLNLRFIPDPDWAFSIKAVLLSDMNLKQLNFEVRYTCDSINPILSWGIVGSLFAFPQYLEDFNRYHILRDTGFTADLNPNFRQITIFEMGMAAGPFVGFNYKRLHGQLSLRAGFSGFAPFDELMTQKETHANLRREIRYETGFSPAVFIYPEAEACFDVIKSGRTDIGFLIRAGSLFSKRAINYTRITQTWTTENTIADKIRPQKQFYNITELEGGLFIRF